MKPEAPRREPSPFPAPVETTPHPAGASLWESLLSRENLAAALSRVEQNAGAPGTDGMRTTELREWLRDRWPEVRATLDAGTYRPQPVRRVRIPKPTGEMRELGVPTALDRMIQQALSQVLTPIFDPAFADESFGFRPGRSAHGAVEAARRHLDSGAEWVVDLDLDRFFDRVGHDRLMARVARRVSDKQVEKSAVAWAGKRPFLGFSFFRRKEGWKIGVDRQAPKRAKRQTAPADRAHLGRPDGAADRRDQPLHPGLDGLLRPRRGRAAVRRSR